MKNIIYSLFRALGYKISKIKPALPGGNLPKGNFEWIKNKQYKTIIDIGANEGQFAFKMRSLMPEAKIISFEPLKEPFEQLTLLFKGDPHFSGYNFGLGDKAEEMNIFMNEYSPSSSLLQMKDLHKNNFVFAQAQKETKVIIKVLDEIIDVETIAKPYLLKIDVQGYEDKVINGGTKIVSMADTIFIEVSFLELYEGQSLFDKTYQSLKQMGFEYMGNLEQLKSPIDGSILQADAIFKKKS